MLSRARLLSIIAAGAFAGALTSPAAVHAQGLELPCLLPTVTQCDNDDDTPAQPRPSEPRPQRGCADADLMPSNENRARLTRATLCLVNKERTRRGRVKLKANRTLARVATAYARQMVMQRFFDHVSPVGTTLVQRVRRTSYLSNVARWSLGENLAWGTGNLGTPSETVRAWMRSPGHRDNILQPKFREIGIGVKIGVPVSGHSASSGATYTQVFGRRVKR